MQLTHLDANNHPSMVDVSHKDISIRKATASGIINMNEQAFNALKNNSTKKGPILQTAVIAAIMGAKRTSELIPLCHPLIIDKIETDMVELSEKCALKLIVRIRSKGKTGVEMEALSGVSIGLLTIYDMLKSLDRTMRISDIVLESKEGGQGGNFIRSKTKTPY